MTDEIKTNSAASFEELLEQSLKTLHTGEKVTGVVTAINATDITVDLGVKQAGYIPTTEPTIPLTWWLTISMWAMKWKPLLSV